MLKERGSDVAVGVVRVEPVGVLTPAEFGAQFDRASRRLWCVAMGVVGDAGLAEDVVQEAAGIALGKLEQFDPTTSFNAWMGQIVRFVAMNERRRGVRQRTTPVDPAALAGRVAQGGGVGGGGRDGAEGGVGGARVAVDRVGQLMADQDAFDDSLTRALGELGEMARACLLLRTIVELTYAEIAEVLGIPEGTAMSHVHRSRRTLREVLGGSVAPSSDAVGGAVGGAAGGAGGDVIGGAR